MSGPRIESMSLAWTGDGRVTIYVQYSDGSHDEVRSLLPDLQSAHDDEHPNDDDKTRELKRARRAERHERLFLQHHEAYLKLTGREPREREYACPDPRLLSVLACARGMRRSLEDDLPEPARYLIAAIDAADGISTAPEHYADAQGWRQGKEQGLTAEERQALRGFNSRIKAGEVTATPNEWNLIVAALDKLLALQGEPRHSEQKLPDGIERSMYTHLPSCGQCGGRHSTCHCPCGDHFCGCNCHSLALQGER